MCLSRGQDNKPYLRIHVDVDRLYMCISAVHVSIVPRFDLDRSGATSPCNSSSAPHWSHGRYAGGLNKLNEAERSGAEFPGVDEGVSPFLI